MSIHDAAELFVKRFEIFFLKFNLSEKATVEVFKFMNEIEQRDSVILLQPAFERVKHLMIFQNLPNAEHENRVFRG